MSDQPTGAEPGATTDAGRDAPANERIGSSGAAATPATEDTPTSTVCGKPIRQDDIVCPHCGTPLVAG